jgi:hypothetical protein
MTERGKDIPDLIEASWRCSALFGSSIKIRSECLTNGVVHGLLPPTPGIQNHEHNRTTFPQCVNTALPTCSASHQPSWATIGA